MNKTIGTKEIIIDGRFHFSIERELFIFTKVIKLNRFLKLYLAMQLFVYIYMINQRMTIRYINSMLASEKEFICLFRACDTVDLFSPYQYRKT
jgi:hypothetical protein